MKLHSTLIASAIVLASALASCEDSSPVGGSLITNNVEILMDSSFTVTGRSIENPGVQSRTVMQLLGRLNADNYGTLSSDVVTQFISSQKIDTTGYRTAGVDSVKLVLGMAYSGFTGDSLAPMGIEVYPLVKALPSPIYSDFDPSGYYDASRRLGSTVYSAAIANLKGGYNLDENFRYINIDLPRQLGVDIINKYIESPQTFATPEAFTKWFPGIYIKNSWGSGRVINISTTTVRIHYHYTYRNPDTKRDTVLQRTGTYLAVSPEVVTNNNISYTVSESLRKRVTEGEAILSAPAGLDVEFTFPARDIVDTYRRNANSMTVVNDLSFTIPVSVVPNNYAIAPPSYILMVKKSYKDKFFAEGLLNDSQNAFYAKYDSSTGSYNFTGLRGYIVDLIEKGEITADDTDFVFTPVYVTTQSTPNYYTGQSTVTVQSIIPYVLSPVMCRFDFEKSKIKFIYSKQNLE